MSEIRLQAKDVICAIIDAAGGELRKKTALFKAFYYAHLYYWQEEHTTLTDYPIVHMPHGPGIDEHASLLAELENEGRITIQHERYGPFQEYVYKLNEGASVDRTSSSYRAIEKAVQWIRDKNATELSEETHDYSRSWQLTADGEEQNIYIDLLTDEEYDEMKCNIRRAEELVNAVFSPI